MFEHETNIHNLSELTLLSLLLLSQTDSWVQQSSLHMECRGMISMNDKLLIFNADKQTEQLYHVQLELEQNWTNG